MKSERDDELFEKWWESEGQYHRAGGGDYEKTFAYHAWITSAKRKGYKLVPVEPTVDMLENAADEHFLHGASYAGIYKAMIEAAQ